MRLMRQFLVFGRAAQAATASFTLALMLVLGVVAVSPTLHERFHSDGGHSDHTCLLCAFANGQISAAETAAVLAVVSIFLIRGSIVRAASLVSALDDYVPPNRGPPRL